MGVCPFSRVLSLAPPCRARSGLALPYYALPCPALPCPALPCPALPCPALSCPALPCPALPPALPCSISNSPQNADKAGLPLGPVHYSISRQTRPEDIYSDKTRKTSAPLSTSFPTSTSVGRSRQDQWSCAYSRSLAGNSEAFTSFTDTLSQSLSALGIEKYIQVCAPSCILLARCDLPPPAFSWSSSIPSGCSEMGLTGWESLEPRTSRGGRGEGGGGKRRRVQELEQ
eukprot:768774-Hanusia_phi.AAC.3